MYKRVGKPVLFIVVLIIAALCYVTVFGIPNLINPTTGDTTNYWIQGVRDLKLGIDINGGIDVTFAPADNYKASAEEMKAVTATLNQRLDDNKITDRYVATDTAHDRIVIRIPLKNTSWATNPEAAIKDLGATAKLTFRAPNGSTILTGSDVKSAAAEVNTDTSGTISGSYYVSLKLTDTGAKKFATATKKYLNKTISIYMDKTEISAPTVDAVISDGNAVISGGDFTSASANALANKINAGALRFALKTENIEYIPATLGTQALNVMVEAGLIAFLIICLFMIFSYRLPGFVACIALCGHLAGTIFAMIIPLFNFTLSLPGIAGIILSIGMGVDCNIITAERIKEELQAGRTLDSAIDRGFEKSFAAIFDGNITVIIAGIILMWKGSSTIISFGFTLIAGVVFNFLMGIIASRLMLKSISRFDGARKNIFYRGAVE